MLEDMLIKYCSPTLAGIKTANLFSYKYISLTDLNAAISFWNKKLKCKNITLAVLQAENGRALIYIYRTRRLEKELSQSNVKEFMKNYGYKRCDVEYCVNRLKSRLSNFETFPHEIGVFLGYPLEDVKGFIINRGKNCKLSGCWKVYCDEYNAQRIFKQYDKCKKVYQKLFYGGRSVIQLTAAV